MYFLPIMRVVALNFVNVKKGKQLLCIFNVIRSMGLHDQDLECSFAVDVIDG